MDRRFCLVVVLVAACGTDDERPALRYRHLEEPRPMIARAPIVADHAATIIGRPVPPRVPPIVLVEADGEVALVEGPLIWSALGDFDPDGLGVTFDGAPDPFEVAGAHVRDGALSGATAGRVVDRARSVGAAIPLPAAPPPGEPREASPEEEMESWVDAASFDDRGPSGRFIDRDPLNRSVLVRAATVAGTAVPGLETPTAAALVVADRAAPAHALVRAVAATEGAIAVAHGGQLTMLRLDFAQARDRIPQRAPAWLEVRLGPGGTTSIEPVPDTPVVVEPTSRGRDAVAVARAVLTALGRRQWTAMTPVDILVDPAATDLTAQHVVDVLAALDRVGVSSIGLGAVPAGGSTQARLRGRRTPTLELGQVMVRGGRKRRDQATLVRHVEPLHDQLQACYAGALAAAPSLAGHGVAVLDIADSGAVTLKHMHPGELEDCFRPILAGIALGTGQATQVYVQLMLAPDGLATAPVNPYARMRVRRR